MTTKSDVISAAKAHTASYLEALLSPTKISCSERADKMASHYLPRSSVFMDGEILSTSAAGELSPATANVLNLLDTEKGLCIEMKSQDIKAIGEDSAIVSVTYVRKGKEFLAVYFYRRLASGEHGLEGGNFDQEARMLRELAAGV